MLTPVPRRRGFTLVELLVVIGIIAILIGLLLPSLAKSRMAARKAACLSNVRQFAVATQSYLIDYKGVMPPHRTQALAAAPADPLTGQYMGTFWGDLLMPYLKTTDVFCCPEVAGDNRIRSRTGSVNIYNYDAAHVCYGYNAYFLGHFPYPTVNPVSPGLDGPNNYSNAAIRQPVNWLKVTQVRSPQQCMMFGDAGAPTNYSLWWPHAGLLPKSEGLRGQGIECTRHGGVGCMSFVDGHGEVRRSDEINPNYCNADLTDPTNSKFWDPFQR